jgi:hypothetical protein
MRAAGFKPVDPAEGLDWDPLDLPSQSLSSPSQGAPAGEGLEADPRDPPAETLSSEASALGGEAPEAYWESLSQPETPQETPAARRSADRGGPSRQESREVRDFSPFCFCLGVYLEIENLEIC